MEDFMSNQSTHGPEPIPQQAWYFLIGLVATLALLIAGWIIKVI
jgi:hypothetical protein